MAEIAKFESRRKKAAKCPICGRPPEGKYKPFCSRRCADVDLSRWLGEVYRVPTDERPEDGVMVDREPDAE
ncbi:MAG TPA: DNA gyrase inhibitor YacG [Alphaproteobacteria bacterium]|nr:DNA gyrase inhibitor YacG [Alphaproteobacteria bacterium]